MVSVAPKKLKYDLYDYYDVAMVFLGLDWQVQFAIGHSMEILTDDEVLCDIKAIQDKVFCVAIKEDRFDEFRLQVLAYGQKSRTE